MPEVLTQKSTAIHRSGFNFTTDLADQAKSSRKGEKTKNAIQVAVCICLERISLADLTIANICECANVSHGTFYIYFPNRTVLMADVLLRFSQFVQAKMRWASTNELGGPIHAATSAYVYLFEQNQGLMKCLLRHLEGFPEAQTAFQNLNREWLETVVASKANHLRMSGRAIDQDELMRRAYALGGMVDQYMAGLMFDKDPNMQPFSQNLEAVIDTLSLLWERGMET